MVDWSPIARSELEAVLLQEIAAFEATDHDLWSRYKVALRTAPILRSPEYGIEQVFVVAALANRVLFFDDVEDEFGVARLPDNGPLEDYGFYGELRYALRGLAQYA